MSRKTLKYTPIFPEMQNVFIGRKNISAKKKIEREINNLKSRQLWVFRQLFATWIPSRIFHSKDFCCNKRDRVYNLEIVFWAFLNQILMGGTSCSETVKKVQSWMLHKGRQVPSSNTSAYCQARKKIPLKFLKKINKHIIKISSRQKSCKSG
jgi:hypothetical protein